MKKLFQVISALMLTAGFPGLTLAENEKPAADAVLTAIDVADLIHRGSRAPDIAEWLSSQRGFDRASARSKGKTDEQIINYLITNTAIPRKEIDGNQSMKHKADGDKYYHESQYQKAAKEYSLAATSSREDYEPYKLRGDTYKQYLAAKFPPLSGSGADEAKDIPLNKARILLCTSIYADYRKAIEITDDKIRKNISDLNLLKLRMEERSLNSGLNTEVSARRNRTAQDINDMRQLKRLSQSQRVASQADIKMKKAFEDYRLDCGKEDAARREYIKTERENKREKKWMKYAETDETSHFYDKSGTSKSEENIEVWTRRENMNDEMSYHAARVRLNCGKNTIGTIESLNYDEMGNLVSSNRYENIAMRSVFPGAKEELLLKEICK